MGTDQDGFSLPAWIYHDPEFFEVERQAIFRTSWQVVCHLSDIPNAGGPLGDGEVCLRSFARRMRALIPECRLHRAPAHGWSAQRRAKAIPI